jgi:acetyl esterase/lipase
MLKVLPSTIGYQRSTWGGNPSNPYDTTRSGSLGSSSGSGVSVGANLVMASLGEETRASCRGPSNHNSVALILPHKSMIGFDGGAIGVDIYVDRTGILCRSLGDCAKVLDALKDPERGYYDPRDEWSTVPRSSIVSGGYAKHVQGKVAPGALAGMRLGVIRESMVYPRGSKSEQPIVEAACAEIKAVLGRHLGATLVESSDPLWTPDADCEQMTVDFRRALARMVPVLMPDLLFRLGADGLPLPVWITRPAGAAKGPLPTVVLVHGGPWVRGRQWAWSDDAQFLASRGYLVIEPEFRGSTGYGSRLHRAGFRQWGRAMQDDLVDVQAWAVQKGLTDPARVCIAGASYGGYAALMGLARDASLYRCGVAWVAVTDPRLLFQWSFVSDVGTETRLHTLPELLGDPVADKAMLESVTPVLLADRIRAPLFMAFGADDRRVPLVHGQRMREALVEAIKNLPEREQYVMSMYYEHDMNLKEIAAVLGVTESRVCQLHSQSIARLRTRLRDW